MNKTLFAPSMGIDLFILCTVYMSQVLFEIRFSFSNEDI